MSAKKEKKKTYLYQVAELFVELLGILHDMAQVPSALATLPIGWRPKCFS